MIFATDNTDIVPIVDYLKSVLNAARASYECSPMQPQPRWDELSDAEKIEEMEQTLLADIEFGDWYFKVVDENDGHQKFTLLKFGDHDVGTENCAERRSM